MATADPTPGVTDTPTPEPTMIPTGTPAPDPAGTDHLAHIAASIDLGVGVLIVFALTITFIGCVLLVRNLR